MGEMGIAWYDSLTKQIVIDKQIRVEFPDRNGSKSAENTLTKSNLKVVFNK